MERIEWRNVRIKLCHNATRARKTSCHLMLIMYAGDMQLHSGQIHGGEKHKQVTWRMFTNFAKIRAQEWHANFL